MSLFDQTTLGPARLGFAEEKDLDEFVDKLGQFESGQLTPDAWKAFRLLNGVYSQRQEGDKMMLRVKIPQGILGTAQLRALAETAGTYSNGRGHLTTRQNFQFHFIPLAETGEVLSLLASVGLTGKEACGNAVRNVTTCPFAGAAADEPFDTTPYAEAVTRHLLRGTWSSSLPRKFKIAFGGCCGHDCVGASFNDLGFLARIQEGKPGFRVTIGGGLSTLRRAGILAHEFVPAEEVIEISEALVRLFHRTGDRQRRHKARLKFVIDKLGPEKFLAEYYVERDRVRQEGGRPLPPLEAAPPRTVRKPVARSERPGLAEFIRTNARAQKSPEHVAVTIRAPLGDITESQLSALAVLTEEFSEERELRTTVEQNLVLRFVRRDHLASLHAALDEIGLAKTGAQTIADVVSCPGALSCRLAVTASRGMASELSQALEAKPESTSRAEKLPIKISGCPNGCGQHYVAGIGLQGSVRKVQGKAVPQYHVYLGGGFGDDKAKFGRPRGESSRPPRRRSSRAPRRSLLEGKASRRITRDLPGPRAIARGLEVTRRSRRAERSRRAAERLHRPRRAQAVRSPVTRRRVRDLVTPRRNGS